MSTNNTSATSTTTNSNNNSTSYSGPRNRLFSAGSRQAPDPFDQFLEKEGYYRKHTARDPSSLFRCISEQLYDTQQHHYKIREECVHFMMNNRNQFEKV